MKYLKYFENTNVTYNTMFLTTLKDLNIPESIDGNFDCGYSNLTSLQYGPKYVDGDYICKYNELTSLEFCSIEVTGEFNCEGNCLYTLNFLSEKIGGKFNCSTNMLTQLDMNIEKINGDFNCSCNNLTDLYKCPINISGYFDCSDNNLTDLNYHPQFVGGNFYCRNNKWSNPISQIIIDKFEIDTDELYTGEQKEKFGSYKYQKEYLTKNPEKYKDLEQIGYNDKIKDEFDWIFNASDMGLM